MLTLSFLIVCTKGNDEDVWDDTALIQAYERAVGNGDKSKNNTRRKAKPHNSNDNATSAWEVGALCRAPWSEDGVVYDAKITALLPDNTSCKVVFTEYGNSDTVLLSQLRPAGRGSKRAAESQAAAPEASPNHPNPAVKRAKQLPARSTASSASQSATTTSWIAGASCRVHYPQDGSYHAGVVKEVHEDGTVTVTLPTFASDDRVPLRCLSAPVATLPPSRTSLPVPPQNLFAQRFASSPIGSLSRHQSYYASNTPFTDPRFAPPPIPMMPPPPPPTHAPDHDDEALANLLMAWYYSGFYTGYYQGLQSTKL